MSEAPLNLTEGNLRILKLVFANSKLESMQIDFEAIANTGEYANAASARARWNELKQKLAKVGPDGASPKTPSKRKKHSDEETPTKKFKTTKSKNDLETEITEGHEGNGMVKKEDIGYE